MFRWTEYTSILFQWTVVSSIFSVPGYRQLTAETHLKNSCWHLCLSSTLQPLIRHVGSWNESFSHKEYEYINILIHRSPDIHVSIYRRTRVTDLWSRELVITFLYTIPPCVDLEIHLPWIAQWTHISQKRRYHIYMNKVQICTPTC